MAAVDVMDNERLIALDYIVSTKYGYVKDLVAKITQAILDEFVSLGFVIMGYTTDDKTWRVSAFAETYYQVVR